MATYPIDAILPELNEAVRSHPSVVLHAPPGAGKTTRVPLSLLDVMPPGQGKIIMLEPRRIAAVSAARWMARTLGEEAGGTIGYTIRFDERLLFVTAALSGVRCSISAANSPFDSAKFLNQWNTQSAIKVVWTASQKPIHHPTKFLSAMPGNHEQGGLHCICEFNR